LPAHLPVDLYEFGNRRITASTNRRGASESVGKKKQTYEQLYEECMETVDDHEQATLKVLAHKEKQLDGMLFLGADYIQNTIRKSRTGPIDAFFKKK
jgi:hypothetical protein